MGYGNIILFRVSRGFQVLLLLLRSTSSSCFGGAAGLGALSGLFYRRHDRRFLLHFPPSSAAPQARQFKPRVLAISPPRHHHDVDLALHYSRLRRSSG